MDEELKKLDSTATKRINAADSRPSKFQRMVELLDGRGGGKKEREGEEGVFKRAGGK